MTEHETTPDPWPLAVGDTLSNHDWFPFYGHRFLSSGFVARAIMADRREDIGTALILWAEAMRQDPAGTLPDDDLQLASLARFRSVEEWQEARPGVLHGWFPVLVEDGRNGREVVRLGHALIETIVTDMHKRKRGRDVAREAGRAAQRKTRIRKKMAEIQVPDHIIGDDRILNEIVAFFDRTPDLYITPDNVRAAMVEAIGYTGQVARFPGGRNAQ